MNASPDRHPTAMDQGADLGPPPGPAPAAVPMTSRHERLAAIGEVAARIVHDLGNPLTGLQLAIAALQAQASRLPHGIDELQRMLQAMAATAQRVDAMLAEFRDFTRDPRPVRTPMPLGPFLRTVRQTWTAPAQSRAIALTLTGDLAATVRADRSMLFRVFDNLLKNAIEAIGRGPGRIAVRVARARDHVVVEVADTGTGIAAGVDAFAPFASSKQQGLGLGLSTVRHFVAAHGGTVEHRPNAPCGTVFRITLPDAAA